MALLALSPPPGAEVEAQPLPPGFWVLVFGLLCHHTASNPITAEMHTSGAQEQGRPEAPDQIKGHSRNGLWM